MGDKSKNGGVLVPGPNSGTQDAHLLRLPNEILFKILRHLPIDCRLSFSLVSSRCCALARSPQAGLIAIDAFRYPDEDYDYLSEAGENDSVEDTESQEGDGFMVCNLSEIKPWHSAIGSVRFGLYRDHIEMDDTQGHHTLQLCRELTDLPNVDTLEVSNVRPLHDAGEKFLCELVDVALGSVGDRLKTVALNRVGGPLDTPIKFLQMVWTKCSGLENLCLDRPFLPFIGSWNHTWIVQSKPNLKKLKFAILDAADCFLLPALSQLFPNMTEIEIDIQHKMQSTVFRLGGLKACENLKRLSISTELSPHRRWLVLPYLPNLEVLEVEFKGTVDVSAIGTCPNLRKIAIECYAIHGTFPNIETRQLESYSMNVQSSGAVFQGAAHMGTPPTFLDGFAKTMKELSLHKVAFSTGWLAQFAALTTLNIIGCRVSSGEDGAQGVDVAITLDEMPFLRELKIEKNNEITHISATHAHGHMQKVEVSECTVLRDVGGISKCNRVQDVSISRCPNLNAATVQIPPSVVDLLIDVIWDTLFEINHPNLRTLAIVESKGLTSLGHVPMHAPMLNLVGIWHCPELTDINALMGATSLKELELNHVESLRSLEGLRGHPSLSSLVVYGFSNMDLTALATCPKFTSRSVPKCDEISPRRTVEEAERIQELKDAIQRRALAGQ